MDAIEDSRSGALARSEKWILRNGVGIQIMETLSVGAFLTALAVELGASNVTIGIFAATPHLAQLAQIPALFAVEHFQNRKKIYQVAGMVARPMLLVIGLAALLPSPELALAVIGVAFAVRYVAGAFLACSWNSWLRDLVPDDEMGRLFGRRQKLMTGMGIVASLGAAASIDAWKHWSPLPTVWGYSILYAFAFMAGAYSVWATRRIEEPPMPPREALGGWLARLSQPFENTNYRRLIVFLGSWNFAINLAAPFFTVHMLRKMELDLLWVIGLGTCSQMAAFLMVSQWGAIVDRFNNKSVLRVCGPMFVLAIFAWTFTTMPDIHGGTDPLLILIHIATGIASAGVTLAAGNLTLKLAPRGNATTYLATSSLVNSSAAALAAMIGGLTADLLASWELSLVISWRGAASAIEMNAMSLTHWDFYFFLAAIAGIYALHRLSRVEEEGEIQEAEVLRIVIGSMRQGLRNLSTVAGVRDATDFPSDAVEEELHKAK